MTVVLNKEDLDKAIKQYCNLWFPEGKIEDIKVIRTKKVTDLKIEVKITEGDK